MGPEGKKKFVDKVRGPLFESLTIRQIGINRKEWERENSFRDKGLRTVVLQTPVI